MGGETWGRTSMAKLVLIKQNKRHSTIKQKERAWAHDQERQETITTFSMTKTRRANTDCERSRRHRPLHSRCEEGARTTATINNKENKTKLPQFFSDFQSTGIVSLKLHFPMLFVCQQLCSKLSVFESKNKLNFPF